MRYWNQPKPPCLHVQNLHNLQAQYLHRNYVCDLPPQMTCKGVSWYRYLQCLNSLLQTYSPHNSLQSKADLKHKMQCCHDHIDRYKIGIYRQVY